MKAFQGSSSGLFSDNTDSPLGHLNGTSLYSVSTAHSFTLILGLLFISTFSLLFQEVYSSEIFIIVTISSFTVGYICPTTLPDYSQSGNSAIYP